MRVFPAVVVAMGLAVTSAGAQDRAKAPTSAEEDSNAVIIEGCLVGGPSGYSLTKVTTNHPAHEGPEVHPVGTTGSDPASAAIPSYALSSKNNVNLKEHVGRKVEVIGVLLPQTNDATRRAAEKKADETGPAAAKPATPETLAIAVTSVKLVGSACE